MHRWGNKKDMTGDDPPYLSVGTEVSAKYKGAFCEAKIRKVVKSVKCKVQYKNEQGFVFVNDEQIKGLLMPGASVEVKLPDKKEAFEGVIVKVQDLSQYTVVFDDGDIATLRRTALCLKSGRHFAESETLDQLPLTHPEHFSTPVVSGARGSRRRDDMDDSDDEKSPKVEREEDMGKVVCVEIGDKKKSKDNWFPGLVVAPNAQDSIKIDVEEEYLVRSFKDGRYYTVPKNETTDFTRDMGAKVENVTLKQAVEKAFSFLDKNDLPAHWDREQLFRQGESSSESDGSDSDSMDDEPREEKDHFVAQLYKFMDDRGTPINKGPIITSKDVDLYKLFKVVYKCGGYNRVTNRNQWKNVTQKLGFTPSQTNNVKTAYKKYLHSFEDFYRKLGCTLLTRTDSKLRSRSSRPLIRDRDKSAPDKLLLDKDENSSSTNEDTADTKESRIIESLAAVEDSNLCRPSSDGKKENTTRIRTRDPSTESLTDRKSDTNVIKEPAFAQFSSKDVKEEKPVAEKRVERKSAKLLPKIEDNIEIKSDKAPLRTSKSGKKAKPVEKRIKKTENALTQMKEKRSLKERMKAIVQKLKLKSAGANDQKKKKQKPAEDLNKIFSQGVRIKLNEGVTSGGVKSRKLSAGSNDSKGAGSGQSIDKKVITGLTAVSTGVVEPCSSYSALTSKVKKNEEEGSEQMKRKSSSRKRKDDDKSSSSSTESQMYEAIDFLPHFKSVCMGDRLRVYYEPTHESKITYEAKVTNKRLADGVTEYLVHYTGWNNRYDEWITRSRIADNLSWTPSRAKRKSNQPDVSPGSQSAVPEKVETQTTVVPVFGKSEKPKRGSQSPVAKKRAKISIKNSVKQMKNMKAKLESKTKKIPVQKGSDRGSESEDENNQKQSELQKTRSRTEKQKQQDEESISVKDMAKDSDSKKKATPATKRTRSGSVISDSKSSTKKRKISSSSDAKTGKTGTIRNTIIKSLVPRKRANARVKESKDEKDVGETSPASTDLYDCKLDENEETFFDDVKPLMSEPDKSEAIISNDGKAEDRTCVLKITPVSPDEIESFGIESSTHDVSATVSELEIVTSSEESGPPSLKKEISSEDETVVTRVNSAQSFADSYLAENLEVKPKVVKAKLKKESEEKSVSPSKLANRSPCEKFVTKPTVEVKEKTIFTSRSPSEKKSDKTPEKDGKLRNVSSYTSYLNMDKIDLMKKGTVADKVDKPDKSTVVAKTVDSGGGKSVDDIYEFNEPEPVAMDNRTILHRRTASRIFEEGSTKRPTKFISTTVDSVTDADEPCKPSEDTNIMEAKAIMSAADAMEVEKGNYTEGRSPSERGDTEEHTSDEEASSEESLKTDVITLESVKSIILRSSPVDCRLRESPISVGSRSENKSDDEDDNYDAEDSKLVISEPGQSSEHVEILKGDDALEPASCDSKREKTLHTESSVSSTEKDTAPRPGEEIESSEDESRDEVNAGPKLEDEQKLFVKKPPCQSHSDDRDGKNSNGSRKNVPNHEEISHGSVVNDVEHTVPVLVKKDKSSTDKKIADTSVETEKNDYPKHKFEEENDGLLLCEETIPKSPEAKEASDMEGDYPCALRGTTTEIKKAIDPQLARVKNESRSSSFTSSTDTPPTTPEGTGSTPGTSPSEEVSGFSSATFSLNEKSGSNKDSSENETSSDTSEKLEKMKKYSDEIYAKKNAVEFDTYLKNQAEQKDQKSEEATKKKTHSLPGTSESGTEKNETPAVGGSVAQTEPNLPKPKSSIAYILEQIPPEFDSNQRIEFLVQKQEEIRKKWLHYKQEVAIIDRKRKKLRRKQREGRMMTRNEANSLLD